MGDNTKDEQSEELRGAQNYESLFPDMISSESKDYDEVVVVESNEKE